MKNINIYVKGVVYKNQGKGFALSAWGVSGEPVHYIEFENTSAYDAEWAAMRDAVQNLGGDDVLLHIYANQKALVDNLNGIQKRNNTKRFLFPDMQKPTPCECDFIWVPLKESPKQLLFVRDKAMKEVAKRGMVRE